MLQSEKAYQQKSRNEVKWSLVGLTQKSRVCQRLFFPLKPWHFLVPILNTFAVSKIFFGEAGSYRVCQGLWPSLSFSDEDLDPQNFSASSISQVPTTLFCSNYVGWSNQGMYYEIEMHCVKQDVATWPYKEANIFRFNIFCPKTQADWLSRLAT
jgi:hypothetical protein